MLVAEQTALGNVVLRWIDDLRMDKSEVAALAGISRNTLYNLIDGTSSPEVETLLKVANGLATERSGRRNYPLYRKILTEMVEAAGRPDLLKAIPPPQDFRELIAERVKDAKRATQFERAMDRYDGPLDPALRKMLEGVLDLLDRNE